MSVSLSVLNYIFMADITHYWSPIATQFFYFFTYFTYVFCKSSKKTARVSLNMIPFVPAQSSQILNLFSSSRIYPILKLFYNFSLAHLAETEQNINLSWGYIWSTKTNNSFNVFKWNSETLQMTILYGLQMMKNQYLKSAAWF